MALYSPGTPRIARRVILTPQDPEEIEQWVTAHTTPQQVSQRCRIVLAAASRQDQEIAEELEINFKTVALWRGRFSNEEVDCLWEVAAGRARKALYSADKVAAIIDSSLQRRPAGATHWSCRYMVKEHGVSKATLNRIWQSHQIKPHRTKHFKLSRDPKFLARLTGGVGLYLNPSTKALG